MTKDFDFSGRSALVTGAASGIGRATAQWLDAHGIATLHLVDRDAEKLDALKLSCECVRTAGDVSDPEMWEHLEASWDRLDHAVINAGIGKSGTIEELSFELWREVLSVNLDGTFLTLAAAMRTMRMSGGGSAVIVSSATALKALAGIGPYGVSKAAVAHLARIASLEGAPENIRVNAIAPGGVDTAIWDASEQFLEAERQFGRDAALQAMAEGHPRGTFATAAEIADSIGYLLSDRACNVTGHVMVSDGGFTL